MNNSFVCGKKALVIGGTSGIGLCVSKILAEKGAAVYVCGTHNPEVSGLNFISCNFEHNGLQELEHGQLKIILEECSILCVCYGPFVQKRLHDTTFKDWQRMALLDYALPGIAVSKALVGMMKKKLGSILLFGGTRSESPRACTTNAAYLGAKTGLDVIVKSVAREYGIYGICCNAILPGFTSNAPEGYLSDPFQIAEKAVYVIEQRDLNGVFLNVDYGWM
ncbi:MAG: SDR family oxidoreductase [Treponema sp.]|nr:SDR family oxidoreductase [Treponema sp.]